MKNLQNQCGFATFEVILVTAIISVLAFVAVPKFNQTLDALRLDYQMNKFCNTVEMARSMNRSAKYNPEIFKNKIQPENTGITLNILYSKRGYQLKTDSKTVGEPVILPEGFSITNAPSTATITFDDDKVNYNGTVTITSRLGNTAEIIFDSVGRWRGSRNGK